MHLMSKGIALPKKTLLTTPDPKNTDGVPHLYLYKNMPKMKTNDAGHSSWKGTEKNLL